MSKGITLQELDASISPELFPHLGTTTNSGNDYTVSTNKNVLANQKFTVKFNAASMGEPTLKFNNRTAYTIKKANGSAAKIYASVYTLFFDGSAFILLGEGGEYGTATAAQVLIGYTIGTEAGIVSGSMADATNPPHSSMPYNIPGTYTFTVPSNVYCINYFLGGGGGSGGGGQNSYSQTGGGGGGGGFAFGRLVVTPGQQLTVVVGSGGAQVNVNTNGNNGGNSTIGGIIAYGGAGGQTSRAGDNTGYGGGGGSFVSTTDGAGTGYIGYAGTSGSYTTGPGVGGSGAARGYSGNGGNGGNNGQVGTAGENGRAFLWW